MKLVRFASSLLGSIMIIGSLGCSLGMEGRQRLNLVRLNMSKLEVGKTMGRDGQARASETTAEGRVKEVWDYEFTDILGEKIEVYRFIFIDDRLTKWGKK